MKSRLTELVSSGAVSPVRKLLNIPLIRFGRGRWPKLPTIRIKHAIFIVCVLLVWRFFGSYLLKEVSFWNALWLGAAYALAPQVLIAFLVYWSPAGMIILKIPEQGRTLAYLSILGGWLYHLYLTIELMYRHRPLDESQYINLIFENIGIHILTIIAAVALWMPTEDDLRKPPFNFPGGDDFITG